MATESKKTLEIVTSCFAKEMIISLKENTFILQKLMASCKGS